MDVAPGPGFLFHEHNMVIRQYAPRDQDQVISLWEKCDLVSPLNSPAEDISRKMRVNPELFLVGVREGRVIASVMGGYEGHRGWVNYLAVDPHHQRCGFGRQIMNHIERLLRAKGCPKINLQIRSTNLEVLAFYRSLGFSDDNVVSLGKRLGNDLASSP